MQAITPQLLKCSAGTIILRDSVATEEGSVVGFAGAATHQVKAVCCNLLSEPLWAATATQLPLLPVMALMVSRRDWLHCSACNIYHTAPAVAMLLIIVTILTGLL